ncbi:MAG: hypothetical protein U5J95_05630 [Balneolaceae bacterium]|nr:hypothetical protein [Balneolaceae bacterium]
MNTGIVVSFVVGGLFMIALLTLNNRVMLDSTKSNVDLANKQRLDGIRTLVDYDFSSIGSGKGAEITSFSSKKIEFKADLEGNGTKTVIWEFKDNDSVDRTKNPNDYKLIRTIKNKSGSSIESQLELAVVDFKMTAYDEITDGSPTTQVNDIESFLIEIVYQSAEPTGKGTDGNDYYPSSRWRKYIVPNNLQLNTKIK